SLLLPAGSPRAAAGSPRAAAGSAGAVPAGGRPGHTIREVLGSGGAASNQDRSPSSAPSSAAIRNSAPSYTHRASLNAPGPSSTGRSRPRMSISRRAQRRDGRNDSETTS